ncbi:hypothetical protein LTR99_009996 [Exophiala xenobiotica]|uniref:histidine kinase n=1 Tax=Vermiconidia calcicola TaxID=1690605 RepID=A0AAV9PZW8_9PEZI|nr:hypothetical protein LTR92_004961 [Exophiala xenobiotica]KAK5530385.1 hypothetical protein LTR25_008963 [Vermiconidia calcicola]KAK5532666.1 hypothetical protein LTR23_009476 [Chaetothyriales sp. CCFEE 6169]KAK5264631.1 hypothetical protein LTR96_010111 [Exophiala xenobiotica]KAK5293549.1 hypothetical protein LTR99_009996 [Exophiala xenobiotica]
MDKATSDSSVAAAIERQSLCLPSLEPGVATQHGEKGFVENITRHFNACESNAAERLMSLKQELRDADTETFWRRLMEGMTEICRAQYGFVAKRILRDDQNSAVEMPPLGETGSCLLGVAFYYNDGDQHKAMHRDYKYLAWGAPCAYMKHDKVFIVPEQMSSFITDNPNALPFPAEGYIGLPLFSGGRCFAHFGMMWSQEGLNRRDTSWNYIELLLHSLEDMVTQRLVAGEGFAKPRSTSIPRPNQVIPREAITARTQSLKPYAKSLSHELRTPMQGVVGMLDVMHATVQEQIESLLNPSIRHIFHTLKDNIEIIQDSAKRAVEAADNVVHAYDMNMEIPDTPLEENDSPATTKNNTDYFGYKPARLIEGSDIHVNHSYKRRRSSPTSWHFGNASKIRQLSRSTHVDVSPKSTLSRPPASSTPKTTLSDERIPAVFTPMPEGFTPSDFNTPSTKLSLESDAFPTPGLKNCKIRDLIPMVIHESLRVGGRPDSAIGEPIDNGERIAVRSRYSNGQVSQRMIEWTVADDVPETLLADERDLAKLVSAVFLNAVKFTEEGFITLSVRLSSSQRYLAINVRDTGDGIPEDFQPELFKPFSREDDSLTRSKEGLGLGLLVAKGLARRLGGDVTLVGSEVSGPHQGSEFEIKIPMEPGDASSRISTPGSKTPELLNSLSRPFTIFPSPDVGCRPSSERENGRKTSPWKCNDLKLPTLPTFTGGGAEASEPRKKLAASRMSLRKESYDRNLAQKHPLTFLVAEDNKINRKLLVSMLGKLGYKDVHEAFDGKEAVRIMRELHDSGKKNCPNGKRKTETVDVILMDLWMPEMDGYEATEHILAMFQNPDRSKSDLASAPIVLAVSADVTDEAINRATRTGMEGFMTKPYKLTDLQKLIVEFCIRSDVVQVPS